MKQWQKYGIVSCLGFFIGVILWLGIRNDFFVTLVDKVNFTLFQWSQEKPMDDIIIVAFDNKTLNSPEFNRFQDFSRGDYADLLEKIEQQAPKAIGVDVFFYNPSEDKTEDEKLGEILKKYSNIVIGNEFMFDKKQFANPSKNIGVRPFQKGYVNLLTKSFDKHSAITHVPLLINKKRIEKALFEPLVFRIWRQAVATGIGTAEYNAETYTLLQPKIKLSVPYKKDLIGINYFGDPGSFRMVSLYDIWKGANLEPDLFRDKIVLIGATAQDLHDDFVTPRSNTHLMSGVEIHANFLQTLFTKKFIYYPDEGQEGLFLFGVLCLAGLIFIFFDFLWASVGALILGVAIYGGSVYLFLHQGILMDFTTPMLGLLFYWGTFYAIRFLGEEKQKRKIRGLFSRYVSADIVEEVIKNPDLISLGGSAKEITVFFSDLAGFTTLAEKLSPTDTMQMLNDYLDVMTKIVLGNKGTVDKYMGDAIMAFWGAPLPCPDQAVLACETALLQQEAIPMINKNLAKKNLPALAVRIGIHSGVANVGNIGTADRLEYTAIGDNINLGSRLEGINKQYGTFIIISEATYKKIGDKFVTRMLDIIRVKGKHEPVKIFELMGRTNKVESNLLRVKTTYEKALKAYQKQDWKESENLLVSQKEDPPSVKLLERIEILKKQKLPADWDGVFVFKVK